MTLNSTKSKSICSIAERGRFWLGLSVVAMTLIFVGVPPPLNAGDTVVTTDADAEFTSTAQLTITPLTIHFPNANPGIFATVPAQETMSVTANAQIDVSSTATLTVMAGGNLISGTDSIPINKVSWTATGNGFASGTMSKDDPVAVGSWVGPGQHSGTISFSLANSWSYATGQYSQTVTYTLTAP
jgi:hypothetical protein